MSYQGFESEMIERKSEYQCEQEDAAFGQRICLSLVVSAIGVLIALYTMHLSFKWVGVWWLVPILYVVFLVSFMTTYICSARLQA